MSRVIYPGSFDPITNGHLDVIERARRIFDEVIVAIASRQNKHPLFNLEERRALTAEAVQPLGKGITVTTFDCLLVDYVKQQNASAVVRGLRAVSDFEYEFQLALMNRKLSTSFETIFLMPRDTYSYLSSSIVKEISQLGGDTSAFIPPNVEAALKKKWKP
jgi:pantetheine-phosphate adenylyltransferase